MHPLDQGHIKLKLLVGCPPHPALRLAEVIEQDQELLLGDRLAQARLIGRFPGGRMCLGDQDVTQEAHQFREQAGEILASLGLIFYQSKSGRRVAVQECGSQRDDALPWGSSSVLRRALKAAVVNMCTSSIR